MATMKDPPHPGRIGRQECIEPLGLSITAAAKHLGVTRQALNNLVNGKAGISAEMAMRLPAPHRHGEHCQQKSVFDLTSNGHVQWLQWGRG
jgi:addiction module HigA family antidote